MIRDRRTYVEGLRLRARDHLIRFEELLHHGWDYSTHMLGLDDPEDFDLEPDLWESSLLTRIQRLPVDFWLYRLTLQGKYLLAGVALVWSVGTWTAMMPLYHLVCGLASLLLISLAVPFFRRSQVEIRGEVGDKAVAGQKFTARLHVRNVSSHTCFVPELCFLNQPTGVERLPEAVPPASLLPGVSMPLSLKMLPVKRGLYRLPEIHVCSTFPFNLWRISLGRHTARPLLVLPDFHPLVGLDIPVGRRYQPGGIAMTSKVGESLEYIGNREYRPGDPPRWIDFRSWARLTQPVVKEFQEEYYCRVALVLDTHIPTGRAESPAGFPELEAGVSLAAAVGDSLSREEYVIDLFAAGPVLHVFRSGRSLAHFENLLEILACVRACRSNPFDRIAPPLAEELGNITTTIFILLDWDDARRRIVQAAAEAETSVKVIILRDRTTTRSFAEDEDWTGPIALFAPQQITSGRVEVV